MYRVNLQIAYVLHTRNYTDSRVLVELFTADHGRVGTVARSSKKGGRFALLRPFQPLLVSWQGKSDLKSLVHTESAGPPVVILGDRLYCGMYLNELLLRVLATADPHPALFETYRRAVECLAQGQNMEPILRNFELDLLAELGYGIPFDVDTQTGQSIMPELHYYFAATNGFTCTAQRNTKDIFSGELILAVGRREFEHSQVLLTAKQLCRLALQPLLGGKPLKSRELFTKEPLNNKSSPR